MKNIFLAFIIVTLMLSVIPISAHAEEVTTLETIEETTETTVEETDPVEETEPQATKPVDETENNETQAPTDAPAASDKDAAEAPKSNAGLIIGIIVGILAIGAAVYFFVIKKKKA